MSAARRGRQPGEGARAAVSPADGLNSGLRSAELTPHLRLAALCAALLCRQGAESGVHDNRD
ncbi:hypothetical protein [Streptomyces halobius]|uniref:Uncharacterized protein n=1 Tax=Streptomyces halobius TaxID=2879846 RepID=A0ABY4MGI7_9ACTN|nr:hypothetical protein [Streptomyces halobius]UQA96921.1 hypothetical protein K9S39_38140 [Streptomyces halobius]